MTMIAQAVTPGNAWSGNVAWWEAFNSASGVAPVLVLDYAGVQFMANNVQKTFAELHTFTRASIALQRISSGAVAFAPHNLFSASEDLDNGTYWTPSDVNIADEGTYNGLTLQTFTENTDTDNHVIFFPGSHNPVFPVDSIAELSVFMRAGTRRYVHLSFGNTQFYAMVDTQTWTITDSGGIGGGELISDTLTLVDATNEIYQLVIKGRANGGAANVFLVLGMSDSSTGSNPPIYTGDGSSTIIVGGLQVNYAPMAPAYDTFADTYVPTVTAAVQQHRLDHDKDGGASGIFQEHPKTNICLWSDDLTDAVWDTVTNMTAAKDQTGADGGANTASSLLATAANAIITQAITASSALHIFSAFVQRITGSGTVEITLNGGTTWLDITSQINSSDYIQVETARTTVANPVVGFRLGTDTDKIAVQYCQAESADSSTNASSSPIPTTTVSVTRALETIAIEKSGFSFDATKGTFYAQAGGSKIGRNWPAIIRFNNSSRVMMRHSSNNDRIAVSLGFQVVADAGSGDWSAVAKGASAYDETNLDIVMTGGTLATDTGTLNIGIDTSFKLGSGNASEQFNSHILQLSYFDVRLSNSDLEALVV